MSILSELKQQYNKNLDYFYDKACKAMEDPDFPDEVKTKWRHRFQQLIDNWDKSIIEIEKELGREMTHDEIQNGFKEEL